MSKKKQRGKDKLNHRMNRMDISTLMRIIVPKGELPFFPKAGSTPIALLIELWIVNPLKELIRDTDKRITATMIEAYIREILAVDTRDVVRYRADCDFYLTVGNMAPMGEIPIGQTEIKARTIKKGDTILVRYDAERPNHEPHYDLQILTAGLFGSFDEDWKVFTLTERDLAAILHLITQEKRILDYVDLTYEELSKNVIKRPRRRKSRPILSRARRKVQTPIN